MEKQQEQALAESRKLNPDCGCEQRGERMFNCRYHEGMIDGFEIAWQACDVYVRQEMLRLVLQLDIKEIIEDHETNYLQRPDGKWDWLCSCGIAQWFHGRQFAIDMTRAHWTDEIVKAIRSLINKGGG